MDNLGFVLAAFGITVAVISGYILVLRARLRAAQSEIDHEHPEP
jgi:CcmD family protein